MYIQANLPEDYGAFKAIQRQNFPFNKSFEHFIITLSNLQDALGYDIYDTIGFVESNLVFIGVEPRKDNTKMCTSFRFKTFDSTIINFYEKSPLNNKLTTILICRLIISLSEVYNTSLNNMSYLLRKLQSENQTPIQYPNLQQTQPNQYAHPQPVAVVPTQMQQLPVSEVPQAPVTSVTPASAFMSVSESHSEIIPVETSEVNITSESSESLPQIKTTKKLVEPRSTSKRVSESKKTTTEAPFAKPVATSPDVDALSKRASKLAKKIEETKAKPGTNITTNPLLADFL